MSVSLYAWGSKRSMEIGQYGMTLSEAKEAFIETTKKVGCKIDRVQDEKDFVVFQLSTGPRHIDKLYELLGEFATIKRLSEPQPPFTYMLKLNDPPKDGYIRTNLYED